MRRNLVLGALLAGLFAWPVAAADERIAFGPVPEWAHVSEPLPAPANARGALFFLFQDAQAHLDQAGQHEFVAFRVRILHPNALQIGNIALSWNPAAGKPVIHRVVVHRDGEARDVLATSKFAILEREDQLEEALLTGRLTAALRVPDLRVGDELEVAYTLPGSDPTLGPDSSGLIVLGNDPLPGRYEFRLSWEEGQEPNIRFTPDLEPFVTREKHAIMVAADMPGPIAAPKDAPPRFAWQRILEYSDFADWQAVSRRFAPLYAQARIPAADSPLREEAARIAARYPDARGRADAALRLVQQQVRYIYVGLNGGNYMPATADQTWERRYGDCKGKTALLLALLDLLEIPAEAVLASNEGFDDGLQARSPTPLVFDHVLVRATIAGEAYWLDGTLPPVIPALREPLPPYRFVLPLSEAGDGLEPIHWRPAERPDELVLYELDLRGGMDAPAEIRQLYVVRGLQAVVEYLQYSAVTDSQLLESYRQELEGGSSWDTIATVSWRFDEASLASVLEITGTGPLDWDLEDDGSRSLALPGGGFSPPERRQRSSGQDQLAPFYNKPGFDCRVTTVRLPEDTLEEEWSHNATFDVMMYGETYRRSFERRDGSLRMIRSTRTLLTEVSPENAARDNGQLPGFDNSMAWLEYRPGSEEWPIPEEEVPASYERDWVADDSACLGPTERE